MDRAVRLTHQQVLEAKRRGAMQKLHAAQTLQINLVAVLVGDHAKGIEPCQGVSSTPKSFYTSARTFPFEHQRLEPPMINPMFDRQLMS